MLDILNNEQLKELTTEKRKRGVGEKYPFSKLEVGQGFKIPNDSNVQSFRCLAYQRGKALGWKFSVSVNGYVERVE